MNHMLKKIVIVMLFIFIFVVGVACGNDSYVSESSHESPQDISSLQNADSSLPSTTPELNAPLELRRFNHISIDLFDTVTQIIGYASSQSEFDYFRDIIINELAHLHKLFDIFSEYPNINNMRTINLNAGVAPIEVDPIIIEMLLLGIRGYEYTNGLFNIALGPVLSIWHEYRIADANILPCMERLQAANVFTNINDVIIDEINNTVFLRYENMSLDVGGVAKGFAIEHVVQVAQNAGFNHFVLSVGGDVRMAEAPPIGERNFWNTGVRDPFGGAFTDNIVEVISGSNISVLSSGDYGRFFMVDGVRYSHIIDPTTLMPATKYRAVTVIHPDAGINDVIITAAFLLDIYEATQVLNSFQAQAVWILQDGSLVHTPGFWQYS